MVFIPGAVRRRQRALAALHTRKVDGSVAHTRVLWSKLLSTIKLRCCTTTPIAHWLVEHGRAMYPRFCMLIVPPPADAHVRLCAKLELTTPRDRT